MYASAVLLFTWWYWSFSLEVEFIKNSWFMVTEYE